MDRFQILKGEEPPPEKVSKIIPEDKSVTIEIFGDEYPARMVNLSIHSNVSGTETTGDLYFDMEPSYENWKDPRRLLLQRVHFHIGRSVHHMLVQNVQSDQCVHNITGEYFWRVRLTGNLD